MAGTAEGGRPAGKHAARKALWWKGFSCLLKRRVELLRAPQNPVLAGQAHEELDAEQLEAFVRERFGGRDSAALGDGIDDGAPAGAARAFEWYLG